MDISASHAQIHALKADLEALDKGAMDDFAANETHIQAHKLPGVIEQRQQAAVKTYRDRMDTLLAELKAADDAKDQTTFLAHVNKAKAHLDKVQVKPFHAKFDPKNLPFSVAKPTGIKPRLSKKDYQARPVAPPKRAQVAAIGPLTGILTAADVTGALPTSPSDPSYVAATDDVQITPAIQAQAAALHNDPVQIYNWVHNNIEYIPTYGSIQGSDMTLQTLKGNDFDQASLLIALLRASGIPSRYVYGTIQVPIAQVENWVGGVTDPNAALNLMSQGGIPVTGLVQGGQIKFAQLEHVWAEAWVNFIPSRAAKTGAGNAWISMDSSFKQYTYSQGMNLQQAVPFDANGLAQHVASTSTINSVQGTVSGVDANYFQQQMQSYQSTVASYITNQNSTASWADIFGDKAVVLRNQYGLSAGLPYAVNSVGDRFASLPDRLRWKFSVTIQDSAGNQVSTYVSSTTDLAGKKVGVTFSPATASDLEALTSYFPALPNGTPYTIDNLPPSLPGYLVGVTPSIDLDGATVASGGQMSLGSELSMQEGYWSPKDGWQYASSTVVAGEYHAIGLDLQGISNKQITDLKSALISTGANLAAGDSSPVAPDSITGDVLQAHILSYFAVNDGQDKFAQRISGIVEYREPSFGTFKTTAKVISNFGIPQSVAFPGVTLDVNWVKSILIAHDGNAQILVPYYLTTGSRLSSFENIVPEQSFSTSDLQVNGISAIKILALAQQQGQVVYHINGSNVVAALQAINTSDDVKQDVENAVNAGDEVTIPQNSVSYAGWSGTGYIIIDPTTGSAAYKISGGANGGFANVAWGGVASYGELLVKGAASNKILVGLEQLFIDVGTAFVEKIVPFLEIGNILYKCRAQPTAAAVLMGYYAIGIAAVALLFATPIGPLALSMFLEVLAAFIIGQLIDFIEDQLVAEGSCPQ